MRIRKTLQKTGTANISLPIGALSVKKIEKQSMNTVQTSVHEPTVQSVLDPDPLWMMEPDHHSRHCKRNEGQIRWYNNLRS